MRKIDRLKYADHDTKDHGVAAATFLLNFLKFWAPPYHLKLFDLVRSCFDSEYHIAACFQRSFVSDFRVGSKV